jgi:hypothetical protein
VKYSQVGNGQTNEAEFSVMEFLSRAWLECGCQNTPYLILDAESSLV